MFELLKRRRESHCSFCGRQHSEVRVLVAGPDDARICERCIADAQRIVATMTGERGAPMLRVVAG